MKKDQKSQVGIWDRVKDRAKDMRHERSQVCACPPNDWTVNLEPGKPGSK